MEMTADSQSLHTLLKAITFGTKLHICIHDLSGLLSRPQLQLPPENTIHSCAVCNAAKTTAKGLRLCLSCKLCANRKAIRGKQPFWGMCPLGITEFVHPIVIHGETAGIVYLGNLCADREATLAAMQSASRLTGVPASVLAQELPSLQPLGDLAFYRQTAAFISGYITLLCQNTPLPAKPEIHWAVSALKSYADLHYDKDITLAQLARLYYLNENYIGRLFRRQMGVRFTAYLNQVRIAHARTLLLDTSLSVTEIAMKTGFNQVPYFNRCFKANTGMTPTAFRVK